MKLLLVFCLLTPIQYASGMLIVAPKNADGPQCKLSIDTATAPQDMLELFAKFNNPLFSSFITSSSPQHKSQNVVFGRNLCAEKGEPAALITDDRALEVFSSHTTLQMLKLLKQHSEELYAYMLCYLHTKNNIRTGSYERSFYHMAQCIQEMRPLLKSSKS